MLNVQVLCRSILFSTATLFIACTSFAQEDFSDVEIKTTDLGNGLYMLEGRGGNIGVSVGDDGVILIDDQYAPLAEKITAAVKAISDKEIAFVLNTHWHGDHTGGNEHFGNAGAVIVAQENVRKRMSVEQSMPAFNRTAPASPPEALPVITFSESVTLHFNGHELHAFAVANAHTDGDAIMHFAEANVVHMGDVFFNKAYPFIDFSSGGGIEGVIAAQTEVLELVDDQTQIIPGHGPMATKADLIETRDTLIRIRDALQPLVDEGLSPEDIVARKPLDSVEISWTPGFLTVDQFVQVVALGMETSKSE